MIILTNTTDEIQVSLGYAVGTTQLNCIAMYRNTTSTSITPLRNVVNTNNTSNVTLVGSPAASNSSVVDYISIFNRDTNPADVIIKFSDNGTTYTLFKSRIAPDEKIEYQEGFGFKVISAKNSIKTKLITETATDSNLNMIMLNYDIANTPIAANGCVDVPELSFSVKASQKYYFKFFLVYTADATTTGSRWFLTVPSALTLLDYKTYTSLTTTTFTNAQGQNTSEGFVTATTISIASNATSAATGGNTAVIEGFIYPDVDGRVALRFATEVTTGTITLKKFSFLQYQQTS